MPSSLLSEHHCNFLSRTKLNNPISWWLSSSRICFEGNLRHVVQTSGEFHFLRCLYSLHNEISQLAEICWTCWQLRRSSTCEQKRTAALASCLPLCVDTTAAGGAAAGQEVEVAARRPLGIFAGKSVHMPLGQGILNFSWVTKSKDDEAKLPRFKSWLCHLAFHLFFFFFYIKHVS